MSDKPRILIIDDEPDMLTGCSNILAALGSKPVPISEGSLVITSYSIHYTKLYDDCHNRPSHIYNPADKSVNLSLSLGRIDETLPYIKSVAVEVLEKNYSVKQIGLDSIGSYNFV